MEPIRPRPDANGRYQAWFDGTTWLCIDPHGSIDDTFTDRKSAVDGIEYLNRSRLGLRYDDRDSGCPDVARAWHATFMRAIRADRGRETEPPEWETVAPFFNTGYEPTVAASEWCKAHPVEAPAAEVDAEEAEVDRRVELL